MYSQRTGNCTTTGLRTHDSLWLVISPLTGRPEERHFDHVTNIQNIRLPRLEIPRLEILRLETVKIGNTKIGNTKIGNTKIGNTKIGTIEIGRIEGPFLATIIMQGCFILCCVRFIMYKQ